MRILCVIGFISVASAAVLGDERPAPRSEAPDFIRDVRPILARNCFKCHGPDDGARKAKLRLDDRATAIAKKAIVPGKPDESALVERISATDPNEVMPPPATKFILSAFQKDILKRWIAAGAEYKQHWALVPPQRSPLPQVRRADWPQSGIDHFILARLEAAGLQPSPPADKYTLIRRVYLDLIGLPPTPEEADAFVNDSAPDAYEKLVDRLLASPRYGERWARRWLDLARYADTNGYEKDRPRSIWPYRDWVINALNADLPFDQFTIQQIAGDLLPKATLDQRIATGFHRNTMLNEEGGIDPLEFRFHAMTDRVATTGTTWLGLTLGCAQCHTHKFDPISQREYYQLIAFLNNADEPELDLPTPALLEQHCQNLQRADQLLAELPNRYPVETLRWEPVRSLQVETQSGEKPKVLDDGSVLFAAPGPDKDGYTVTFETETEAVSQLRLEALTHESLPSKGPGRVQHGNFVLNEITISAAPKSTAGDARPVKIVKAMADTEQEGFPIANAFDGDLATGWAVHAANKPLNVDHLAAFHFEKPISFAGGTRFTVKLDQAHGKNHTLGRFRLSLGCAVNDQRPIEVRRQERLESAFAQWLSKERARSVKWTALIPVSAKSNLPLLTVLDDASVFVSGDMSKSDTYELSFRTDLWPITALRLEVLPDERLPKHGPGRIYYEGPAGDFFLSELSLWLGDEKAAFAKASHSFAAGKDTAAHAIDGDPQSGWSINGGQGRKHEAGFSLAKPLEASEFTLRLLFERYYAAGLGRFRISATTDPRGGEARDLPLDLEKLLLVPDGDLTAADRQRLREHFLHTAPELAKESAEIKRLRTPPASPTTLIMQERPPENPRPTYVHHRGEFLQPRERVEPGLPAVLPPLPPGTPPNRLGFAQWLVSPQNPLTARVTVNRHWAAFFGRGLVRTVEDFGIQGEPPTHPELLDWLATEFVRVGWSQKKLHRQIVLSAAYRQSSQVTVEQLAKDPENRLISRGPRVRLEAEMIRDGVLRASGLLAQKLGGPSVFPPQPPSVTTEGAYGQLKWTPSQGEDRYRRSLYTYSKRTTPFAMSATFDAPSGEACVARRDVSNTPLQALTLLNDVMFTEAAQALGREFAAKSGAADERVRELFRRCLTRPPAADELTALTAFYEHQKQRFTAKELDAKAVAGEGSGDMNERAAWTALARVLFNLDEMITKN